MIGFPELNTHGRLGNQLFFIMGTLGLAEKHGTEARFPAWKYEGYFKRPIPHGQVRGSLIKEAHFHHHDWPINGDVNIKGYLQSEKYFPANAREVLQFRDDLIQKVRSKAPQGFWERRTLCLQIRRGDYVGNPNYYQIPIMYYISCLYEHFPDFREMSILVTSDDLGYCRTHFECLPNVYFPDGLSDIEQMALCAQCDDFMIPNSSFGWWCAWLGEKPHSKIVHCGHLQWGKLLEQNDPKDYYPERWIRYQKDDYRMPLRDVTFTIPVKYDSPDRKSNLDLSLCILQQCFDTHVIIGEQGGDRFDYTGQWARYIAYDYTEFHRTKMLNEMAMLSETPYIVNWDCDVIVPPMQICMAVDLLRQGANVVYPYDGRFARMERAWFKRIEKLLDIGIVSDAPLRRRDKKESVGGALIWNKEAYVEYGMENEYMVSYAPEDVERWERMHKLGADPKRVDGTLYHLDHHKGPDSHNGNPHFRRSKMLLEQYRQMNSDQLRQEVDTWPWRHQYTSRYYERIIEGSQRSARELYRVLGIRNGDRVLDIGCGIGQWALDNPNYHGVDYGAPRKMLLTDNYIDLDIVSEDWGSIRGDWHYVLCLEVAEHLPESFADSLIANICRIANGAVIIFGAAIPNQGGTGHINEQWQTYWADKFAQHGYRPEILYPLRNCNDAEYWYRQNIIVYSTNGQETAVNFVLPEYYEQITNGLKAQIR